MRIESNHRLIEWKEGFKNLKRWENIATSDNCSKTECGNSQVQWRKKAEREGDSDAKE